MQRVVFFLAVHMLTGCNQPGEKRDEQTAFSRNGVNSFAEGQSQFIIILGDVKFVRPCPARQEPDFFTRVLYTSTLA